MSPKPEPLLSGAPPVVINLGTDLFVQTLKDQQVQVVQVLWQPPPERDDDLMDLLDDLL